MPDAVTTPALHMYVIDEAGCVTHWAVATSEEEARRIVLEMATVEEPEELEVELIPDDKPHRVHYVDGFDYPDRWREEVPPGATVETDPVHGCPVVTVTAGEWARWFGKPSYDGCSEF